MNTNTYPVPDEWAARATIDADRYREMYAGSVADPEGFWGEAARRLDWNKPFTRAKRTSFDDADFGI